MAAQYKFVVYVPATHADAVRVAIHQAGGGVIGNYTDCSFTTVGTGRFTPGVGAAPAIGTIGQPEVVDEHRIEVALHKDVVGNVIAAVKRVHPYETVAYDVYPLEDWE